MRLFYNRNKVFLAFIIAVPLILSVFAVPNSIMHNALAQMTSSSNNPPLSSSPAIQQQQQPAFTNPCPPGYMLEQSSKCTNPCPFGYVIGPNDVCQVQEQQKSLNDLTNIQPQQQQQPPQSIPPSNNNEFQTYVDNTSRFKIQYPSNWLKLQDAGVSNIAFTPTISSKNYSVLFNISSGQIWGVNIKNKLLSIINTSKRSLPNFDLIQSFPKEAGQYEIVYTYSDTINNKQKKVMEIIELGESVFQMQHNVYYLQYSTDADKYESYLPIILKMIDSFIIPSKLPLYCNSCMPRQQ